MHELYFERVEEAGNDLVNFDDMKWEFISYYRMWGTENE